jgi:hypothetical protein
MRGLRRLWCVRAKKVDEVQEAKDAPYASYSIDPSRLCPSGQDPERAERIPAMAAYPMATNEIALLVAVGLNSRFPSFARVMIADPN